MENEQKIKSLGSAMTSAAQAFMAGTQINRAMAINRRTKNIAIAPYKLLKPDLKHHSNPYYSIHSREYQNNRLWLVYQNL